MKQLEASYMGDGELQFMTGTIKALIGSTNTDVWSVLVENQRPASL